MANVWQTLRGPFSAVSTPIFASKYSFESSWRDLQDLHLCVFWEKITEIENEIMKCILMKRIYTYDTFAPFESNLKTMKSEFKNSAKILQTFLHFCSFIINILTYLLHLLSKTHQFWWNIFGISANVAQDIKISQILKFPEISQRKLLIFQQN